MEFLKYIKMSDCPQNIWGKERLLVEILRNFWAEFIYCFYKLKFEDQISGQQILMLLSALNHKAS